LRTSGADTGTYATFSGDDTHGIGAGREQSRAPTEISATYRLDHFGRYAPEGQRDCDAGRCFG
jgi:hypothetical protein